MPHDLKASVIRILNTAGETVGAGFLVAERLAVTCAHVVEKCEKTVEIQFYDQDNDKQIARVLKQGWSDRSADDVAFLELENQPSMARPVTLGSTDHCLGHDYTALGFPDFGDYQVRWPQGKLGGTVPIGNQRQPLLQLKGEEIDKGCSGGPVLDMTDDRVVGMIMEYKNLYTDKKDDDEADKADFYRTRFAYATTAETLQSLWPELRLLLLGYPGTGAFSLPNTYRSNPYFVPLPEIQAALDALRPGDVLVLHGMGGVGKTQHAVQYAHEHRGHYTHVLWASADSEHVLVDSLDALTLLPELALPIDLYASSLEKVRTLCRWLSGTDNWLLIIDNADSVDSARAIERLLPSVHRGCVIVTARIAEWTSAFHTQHVKEWDESQSVAFLTRRLAKLRPKEDDLVSLARAMAGLPLALEYAAAYLLEKRVSVRKYLVRLESERNTLLARKYPGMTNYPASVATTWHVSIHRLSFLSRYILRIAACFASDPIPRRIFDYLLASTTPYVAHELIELALIRRALAPSHTTDDALSELACYSLISLSEDNLRVHPLLQAVLRDSVRLRSWQYYLLFLEHSLLGMNVPRSREAARVALWPSRAANLLCISGVLPERYYDNLDHYLQMKDYAPHIEAVLRNLPEESFVGYISLNRLKSMLHWYREQVEEYTQGISAIRSTLTLGDDAAAELKEETAWFFEHFEELCEHALRSGEASSISLLDEAASVARLGAEHQMYWAHRFIREIARVHAKAGDVSTARRLYHFCFHHATVHPRASHRERGCSRFDEAIFLWEHIPLEERLCLLEESIGIFEENDDFQHADVLNAVELYTCFAKTADQREAAERWLHKALPFAWELLDVGFVYAIPLTRQIVPLLVNAGKPDEALSFSEETLRRATRPRRLLYVQHARVKKQLAVEIGPLWELRGDLLREKACYLAAARSYARCLRLERRHARPSLWRQMDLLKITGRMFLSAGYVAAAQVRLLEAGSLLEEGWDEDPSNAEIHASIIGLLLGHADKPDEGEALLRRAIASGSKRLTPEDPVLAFARGALGVFLWEAGRLQEAEVKVNLRQLYENCISDVK